MVYVHCKRDECCERRERTVEKGSWRTEEVSWRIKGAELLTFLTFGCLPASLGRQVIREVTTM